MNRLAVWIGRLSQPVAVWAMMLPARVVNHLSDRLDDALDVWPADFPGFDVDDAIPYTLEDAA